MTKRTRRDALLKKIAEASRCGINFIQLREKDLSTRDLEVLARAAVGMIRENSQLRTENRKPATALLINSRTDLALACGANGVHLRSVDILPAEARGIWSLCARGTTDRAVISVSCHSPAEVARAASEGADFAIFAPVFGKRDAPDVRPACAMLYGQRVSRRFQCWRWAGSTWITPPPASMLGPRALPPSASFKRTTLRRLCADCINRSAVEQWRTGVPPV